MLHKPTHRPSMIRGRRPVDGALGHVDDRAEGLGAGHVVEGRPRVGDEDPRTNYGTRWSAPERARLNTSPTNVAITTAPVQ